MPPWITRRSVKDGLYWLLIQVVIGLLPLWGTIVLLGLFGRPVEMYGLLKNGQFVLYAASFATGGLYSLRHDIFPAKNGLLFLLIVVLVFASLIFAAISVLGMGGSTVPKWLTVEPEFLTTSSMWVFVTTTLVCLGITVAEAGSAGGSVADKLHEQRDATEAGLDALINRSHKQ